MISLAFMIRPVDPGWPGAASFPVLDSEIELPGAPDDQAHRPEPGHEVPDVDIKVVQHEDQADHDQNDTPDQGARCFLAIGFLLVSGTVFCESNRR